MKQNIVRVVEKFANMTSDSNMMTRHGSNNLLVLLSIICLGYTQNHSWTIKWVAIKDKEVKSS